MSESFMSRERLLGPFEREHAALLQTFNRLSSAMVEYEKHLASLGPDMSAADGERPGDALRDQNRAHQIRLHIQGVREQLDAMQERISALTILITDLARSSAVDGDRVRVIEE
jgi:hypothetical protein